MRCCAVGRNEEGPLPWIERDYTPISTAKEWEQGRCRHCDACACIQVHSHIHTYAYVYMHGRVDILIKIYNDGAATSWLHHALELTGDSSIAIATSWLHRALEQTQSNTGDGGSLHTSVLPATSVLNAAVWTVQYPVVPRGWPTLCMWYTGELGMARRTRGSVECSDICVRVLL